MIGKERAISELGMRQNEQDSSTSASASALVFLVLVSSGRAHSTAVSLYRGATAQLLVYVDPDPVRHCPGQTALSKVSFTRS